MIDLTKAIGRAEVNILWIRHAIERLQGKALGKQRLMHDQLKRAEATLKRMRELQELLTLSEHIPTSDRVH